MLTAHLIKEFAAQLYVDGCEVEEKDGVCELARSLLHMSGELEKLAELAAKPKQKTVEFFINVYANGAYSHKSKEAAEIAAGSGRIDCVHIHRVIES